MDRIKYRRTQNFRRGVRGDLGEGRNTFVKHVNEFEVGVLLGQGSFGKVKSCFLYPEASEKDQAEGAGRRSFFSGRGKREKREKREEGKQTFALKKMSKRSLMKKRTFTRSKGLAMKMTTALDQLFDHELRIWNQIHHHSHIVTLIQLINDCDEDAVYVVMGYAEGGQLMTWNPNTVSYTHTPKHWMALQGQSANRDSGKKGIGRGENEGGGNSSIGIGGGGLFSFFRSKSKSTERGTSSNGNNNTADGNNIVSSHGHSKTDDNNNNDTNRINNNNNEDDGKNPWGGMDLMLAKQVFRDIVEAVEFIHSRRIIHRDIKPENILIHRISDNGGDDNDGNGSSDNNCDGREGKCNGNTRVSGRESYGFKAVLADFGESRQFEVVPLASDPSDADEKSANVSANVTSCSNNNGQKDSNSNNSTNNNGNDIGNSNDNSNSDSCVDNHYSNSNADHGDASERNTNLSSSSIIGKDDDDDHDDDEEEEENEHDEREGWISDSKGTYHFFAPECCTGDGKSYNGYLVDIWALGVTLYAMTLGTVPWLARMPTSAENSDSDGDDDEDDDNMYYGGGGEVASLQLLFDDIEEASFILPGEEQGGEAPSQRANQWSQKENSCGDKPGQTYDNDGDGDGDGSNESHDIGCSTDRHTMKPPANNSSKNTSKAKGAKTEGGHTVFDPDLRALIRGIMQRKPTDRLTLEQIKNHPWLATQ